MREKKNSYRPIDLLWLGLGCVLYVFVGWRWDVPIAAWLAPVFLIRFFRKQDRWQQTLLALPLMALAGFVNKTGSWDMDLLTEIGLSLLVPAPLWIALYVDRATARRNGGILSTLAYPVVLTALEYAFALPHFIGTINSISGTQFRFTPLAQLAAVTGVWGITFVVSWFAATVNTLWENGFDLQETKRPAAVFAGCLALILLLGGLRPALFPPTSPTVRVGGVTVAHPRNYWGEIIDLATPRDVAHQYQGEITQLNERLFALSEQAAQGGAKIIFWSEGNAVVYEEEEQAFLQRAQDLAREWQVYFAPAIVVLHYGETSSDNKLVMIAPSGEIAYSYTKTISWYATDSDGVLDVVETPYGRISSAICFDMDFPNFLRQGAQRDVDIMLVPGYDSAGIKPYHTYVSLFRGIESGFSIVRQVNEGTSMAADYQGNLLAYQDYFGTADRLMLADVPTQGAETVYGLLGDWFAYVNVIAAAGLALWLAVQARQDRRHLLPNEIRHLHLEESSR